MTLAEYLEDHPKKHLIFDFAGTLLLNHGLQEVPNQELIDFIGQNHQLYSYYIWSSSSQARIEEELTRLEIKHLFDIILGLESVTEAKPSTQGFELLHQTDAINEEEWLFIGNSSIDQQVAHHLNIDFYQVT